MEVTTCKDYTRRKVVAVNFTIDDYSAIPIRLTFALSKSTDSVLAIGEGGRVSLTLTVLMFPH